MVRCSCHHRGFPKVGSQLLGHHPGVVMIEDCWGGGERKRICACDYPRLRYFTYYVYVTGQKGEGIPDPFKSSPQSHDSTALDSSLYLYAYPLTKSQRHEVWTVSIYS